ncbi:MAG TPA: hypothetical protein VHB79_35870 [Polyangiaceae bacterium]|nr:hypothetical protein [Polyangiaceae bacterium]
MKRAAACLLLLLSARARAAVVSEDALAGDSFAVGGSARTYNLVLRGGPLSSPSAPADSDPAAVSSIYLRPELELKRGFGLDFVLHDELASTTSSVPTGSLMGSLSLGQGRQAPVWLPLQWSLANRDTYQLEDRIAWLYARYHAGSLSLTLGRQPVTIGRGQIWTPEDLIAPFSPLQIDTQFKPGADAARLDWDAGEALSVMVVGAAANDNDSALLSRAELRGANLRLGVLLGDVRQDGVAGLDLFVDLGAGTDLHGEGTVTWVGSAERRPWGRRAFSRAVFGTTSELSSKLHVTAEAYFNGAGAREPADYVEELSSRRLSVGEVYNLGRIYAGFAAQSQLHPLLSADLSVIANLQDPSAIVAPVLHYSLAENASIVAGAFIPVGRPPHYSTGITARSEFGLYPQMYHVDAKLWL